MAVGKFLKERWLDTRWGYQQISLGGWGIQIILLVAVYLGIPKEAFIPFAAAFAVGVTFALVAIGNLYRKHQLYTDNVSGNQFLLTKFREIVKEELEEDRKKHGS
jgi:hypothetical protein